jgi:cell division protein FtsL
MAEHQHHHKHHRDSASEFKRRSLDSIAFRKKFEKVLKIVLVVLAVIMAVGVVASRYIL